MPTTDDATTWVVETGPPRKDAARMTVVDADWLANASAVVRRKMRRPIVRTIRQPPIAVPTVRRRPEETLTHRGTANASRCPVATSRAAMTPIAFWPSLAPWPNASAAVATHWPWRTGPRSRGVARRSARRSARTAP